jgi:hypothetical protein
VAGVPDTYKKGKAQRCFVQGRVTTTCIGYLGDPFVKEAPWAFTARLFFVVKGILAIEIAGKSFSSTRENRPVWAADYQGGMRRLYERAEKAT